MLICVLSYVGSFARRIGPRDLRFERFGSVILQSTKLTCSVQQKHKGKPDGQGADSRNLNATELGCRKEGCRQLVPKLHCCCGRHVCVLLVVISVASVL
jgi:hypothetical protein